MTENIPTNEDLGYIQSNFKIPVVYQYSKEQTEALLSGVVRFVKSDFYQTSESVADFPPKLISRIIYE